jgi:hypothetical protein
VLHRIFLHQLSAVVVVHVDFLVGTSNSDHGSITRDGDGGGAVVDLVVLDDLGRVRRRTEGEEKGEEVDRGEPGR